MSERRQGKRFERVVYDTRIDRFLADHGVDLDDLAAALQTSRHNLLRIRRGKHLQRQDTIAMVVLAVRELLGRAVAASDLFYLGEERDDHTAEARDFLRRYRPGPMRPRTRR
jgi:hypothetical protein